MRLPKLKRISRKKKYILIGVLFAVASIGFAIAGLFMMDDAESAEEMKS